MPVTVDLHRQTVLLDAPSQSFCITVHTLVYSEECTGNDIRRVVDIGMKRRIPVAFTEPLEFSRIRLPQHPGSDLARPAAMQLLPAPYMLLADNTGSCQDSGNTGAAD